MLVNIVYLIIICWVAFCVVCLILTAIGAVFEDVGNNLHSNRERKRYLAELVLPMAELKRLQQADVRSWENDLMHAPSGYRPSRHRPDRYQHFIQTRQMFEHDPDSARRYVSTDDYDFLMEAKRQGRLA